MTQYLAKCEARGRRRHRSRLPGVAESSRFWPRPHRDQPRLTCTTLIRPHFLAFIPGIARSDIRESDHPGDLFSSKDAGADDRGSRAREHSGDRLLLTVELVPKASRSGCAAASMSSQSEGQVIPGGWLWFANSLPLSPRPSTR